VDQDGTRSLAPAGGDLPQPGAADPAALLLQDKRSPNTRRAYAAALKAFFGGDPTPQAVRTFVTLDPPSVALKLAGFKARMLVDGLSEATINLRLAAVRALLKVCHRIGFAQTDGRGLVDSERVQSYRDTRGVDLETLKRLLNCPAREALKGLRDRAILRLLAENGLRRAELCALDVADLGERELSILGKGRGTQRERITLSGPCAAAIDRYLEAAGHTAGALFVNLSPDGGVRGGRLTPGGLFQIVRGYGARIGHPKLAPHKIRHSCLTAALEMTSGDVTAVQKLSRHKDVRTLMIYDDRRRNKQGELTQGLAALLGGD
jgi:integrase/recombinase XerC